MNNDWKGSGRKVLSPNLMQAIIPAFTRKDWGKSRKISVRIGGLRAEIWTQDLQIRSRSTNHSTATFITIVQSLYTSEEIGRLDGLNSICLMLPTANKRKINVWESGGRGEEHGQRTGREYVPWLQNYIYSVEYSLYDIGQHSKKACNDYALTKWFFKVMSILISATSHRKVRNWKNKGLMGLLARKKNDTQYCDKACRICTNIYNAYSGQNA
jgi:hypothetical protein